MNKTICRARTVFLLLASLARGEDFCFLQISDVHIEPLPVSTRAPSPTERSADTLTWFCEQAKLPQTLEPGGSETPKPAFAACTGDCMEFGAVGSTFEHFEELFKPLRIPLYLAVGNHDNTWAGIMQIMRKKYGGDEYSFDRFGCHFIFFDSATPQEPAPSLEQRTLTFIKSDLSKVDRRTPVFMFCHHPLSTDEYAKPSEQLRFLEAIRGYNVVCLLMGHGHAPVHEKWGPLDSVMGGSTFGPHTGYSIVCVRDDMLRVVYRFRDEEKQMKPLLEKSIQPATLPAIDIVATSLAPQKAPNPISVEVKVRDGSPDRIAASIDNQEKQSAELAPAPRGTFRTRLPSTDLLPGAHYVRITSSFGKLDLDRAMPFELISPGFKAQRVTLSAGMKAAPVPLDSGLLLATTAGDLILIDAQTGSPRTIASLGAEVLHEPVLVDRTLYVACGTGDVFSLTPDGRVNWKCNVGASTYGTPAIDARTVYVADLQGFVHAIVRQTGRIGWTKRVSDYPIEQSMRLHKGVLYFGAWDGFVYAVSASDGVQKWRSRGPNGQSGKRIANRYYSAADASPIIIGDRLVFADRAYQMGAYTLDGDYAGEIGAGVSAVGASEDGQGFYARGSVTGLARYELAADSQSASQSKTVSQGRTDRGAEPITQPAEHTPLAAGFRKVWVNPLRLGRFPIPPLERDGKVYVCSNLGTVSVLDADTGKTLWQYQATPQLHVMAPVSLDAAGRVCVAGMDGSVTRVSRK